MHTLLATSTLFVGKTPVTERRRRRENRTAVIIHNFQESTVKKAFQKHCLLP